MVGEPLEHLPFISETYEPSPRLGLSNRFSGETTEVVTVNELSHTLVRFGAISLLCQFLNCLVQHRPVNAWARRDRE